MEIPQTTQLSSMELQNVLEMVCATCLSHDRRLYTMKDYSDLRNVCSNVTLESNVSICWECKAVLSRVKQFTAQAVRAKAVLDDIVENMTKPESITSLSSLHNQLNTDFYTIIYKEVKLENVKTEKEDFIEVTILPDNVKQEELAVKSEQNYNDYKYDMDDDYLDVDDESLSYYESDDDQKSLNSKKANESSFHRSKDVTFGVETGIAVKTLSEEQMLEFREKTRNTRRFKVRSHKCEDCIRGFRTSDALKLHRTYHEEKFSKYPCRVCGMRYIDDESLQYHIQTHYRIYECLKCGYTHPNVRTMKSHHLRIHVRGKIRKTPLVTEWQCDKCAKKFRKKSYLKTHMISHDNTRSEDAYCVDCNKQYKTVENYQIHLKTTRIHNQENTLKFECDECGKKFATKYAVMSHIQVIHLKLSNYKCIECPKIFHSQHALTKHKNKEHKGKVKVRDKICHICGQAYLLARNLKAHVIAKHMGMRPYRCKLCDADFGYSAALFIHNRVKHQKKKANERSTPRQLS